MRLCVRIVSQVELPEQNHMPNMNYSKMESTDRGLVYVPSTFWEDLGAFSLMVVFIGVVMYVLL